MHTCMDRSVLGAVVFSEVVSSSKQNISSWVWSAEKITYKLNKRSHLLVKTFLRLTSLQALHHDKTQQFSLFLFSATALSILYKIYFDIRMQNKSMIHLVLRPVIDNWTHVNYPVTNMHWSTESNAQISLILSND